MRRRPNTAAWKHPEQVESEIEVKRNLKPNCIRLKANVKELRKSKAVSPVSEQPKKEDLEFSQAEKDLR